MDFYPVTHGETALEVRSQAYPAVFVQIISAFGIFFHSAGKQTVMQCIEINGEDARAG
jgi:hypothetical protein